jgi:hypothetical protein
VNCISFQLVFSPGAKVARRTHQTLEVPALPNQEVFQTMIDLAIEEREGGYGDRSGKKAERFEFLFLFCC